jgi:putative methyltransferase (TIGR04325 family)
MPVGGNFRIWEGVFRSFGEAKGDEGVFRGQVWLKKIIERARVAQEQSDSAEAIAPVAVTNDYALPCVAALAARPGTTLRILDFGGGLGTSFVPLSKMLPEDQPLEFVIVENDSIVELGQQTFAGDHRVVFRPDIPVLGERFDIVHCGSSLHYVEDWQGMLKQLAAVNPEYILLADLPAADNRPFVTTQKYYGQRLACWFFNFADVVSVVNGLGYRLLFRARYRGYWIEPGAPVPTQHFPPDYRCEYFSQLIFGRTR